MNIKIKASSLYSLIGNDYDRLWTALQTQFGSEEEQIFAERTPGSGYIQWELPGEGWQALSESEPLTAAMVRKLLEERKNAVAAILPNAIAKIVLTVPDDGYIWFKESDGGIVLIRMTAWGYRHPEKIGGTGADGYVPSRENLVEIAVKVTKGSQPCPDVTLLLNGMVRQCGADGMFVIGVLPVGYQFDLEVEGEKRHVMVSEDEPLIAFDFPADPIVNQMPEALVTKSGEESIIAGSKKDEPDVSSLEIPAVFTEPVVEKTPEENDETQSNSEPSTEPDRPSDNGSSGEGIPDLPEKEGLVEPEPSATEDGSNSAFRPLWGSILITLSVILLTVLTYFLSVDILYS